MQKYKVLKGGEIQEILDYLHKNITASIVYEDFHDFSKGIKGAEVDYFPETAEELLQEMGISSPLPIASASIETSVWKAAQDYCRSIGASVTGPAFSAYMASYNTWGKQSQTTQQQDSLLHHLSDEELLFAMENYHRQQQRPLIELLEKVLNSSYVTIRNDDLK